VRSWSGRSDSLLGAAGDKHPLKKYMAAGVPVALATDDEGILRIDATHEYVRAVEEQGLTYPEIKKIARTSLEHAFLRGKSLWKTADQFSGRAEECAADEPASAPSAACKAFLEANDKAGQQWKLEGRLVEFEKTAAAP
jgi:adenosine deaminase